MATAIRQMNYIPEKGEHIDPISETIQGQSLTVNEVLAKFSQGLLPELNQDYFFDDLEDDDFDAFDPTLNPDFDLSDTHYYENIGEESTQPIITKPNESEQETETSETE